MTVDFGRPSSMDFRPRFKIFCWHCMRKEINNRVDWWGKLWPDWRLSFYRECVERILYKKTNVERFSNVADESSRHWLLCWCVSSLTAHYPWWLRGRESWRRNWWRHSEMQFEVFIFYFLQAGFGAKPDDLRFDGFNCRRLDEHHPWMASMHCCSQSMVDPISSIHVLLSSCVSSAYRWWLRWNSSSVLPALPYRRWILGVTEYCPEVHCSSQRRSETADQYGGTRVFNQSGRNWTRSKLDWWHRNDD